MGLSKPYILVMKSQKKHKPLRVPAAAMADPNPVEEVGYCRVSTKDQDPDMQIAAMKRRGIIDDSIFVDIASGAKTNRKGLGHALRLMQGRPGWTLVVWKLDRLGRDVRGLIDLMDKFRENEWNLVSLTEQIDTRTPFGKFYLHVLASLAQLERDMTVERTRAGMARLKEKGVLLGRKTRVKLAKFKLVEKLLITTKTPIEQIAKRVGMSAPWVNHWYPGWRSKTEAERKAFRKTRPIPAHVIEKAKA